MIRNNKINYKQIAIIFLVSGIFGFIYETIFYRFDLGYFVKRGTTFGPWIPIYGFGGVLIYSISNSQKESPIKVLFLGSIISGLLEFVTGYLLYNISKVRLWDYNKEILNFGNIEGFICLRSVLFFGVSGLLLIYVIVPFIDKFLNKENKKMETFSLVISLVFLLDFIINDIIL